MAEALDGPAGGEAAFGARLRRARLAAGLTQEELAERAGLSARGIQDLERGLRATPQRETVRLLGRALGLAPEAVAALGATVVRARRPGPAAGGAGPGPAGPAAGGWWPRPLTSFVGRERELAALGARLRDPAVRLLTLTGPGGVGKTRLALRAAEELRAAFEAVGFVPLGELADSAGVPGAIARALGLEEAASADALRLLARQLAGRRLLLVLDGFEHLLPAAPPLAGLLEACPGLQLLVTSRAVLHLSGEHDLAVPPLSVEAPGPPPDGAAAAEAVQLFAQRARAAQPAFALTGTHAARVAEICRRLDGLPLAIELAAARCRYFSLDELLRRLDRQLPLLTGGPRDLPARQRTLRGACQWSYDLLAPAQQRFLARLAVFAGGWTAEAAAVVALPAAGPPASRPDTAFPAPARPPAGDGPLGTPELRALDGLAALADHSLVQAEAVALPSGATQTRYRLLDVVREFALERLEEQGGADAGRRGHAAWCRAFAEAALPRLLRAEQLDWLERQDREQPNVRAALRWCLDAGARGDADAVEMGLGLAGALGVWFWRSHGAAAEGREWLRALLALPEADRPTRARVLALVGAGYVLLQNDDDAPARALTRASLEEATSLGRALGEPWLVAYALALRAYCTPDPATAGALAAEALAAFRALGDVWGTAVASLMRVNPFRAAGDPARAWAAAEAAVAAARATGDRFLEAYGLLYLSLIAHDRGDHDAALRLITRSVPLREALGDRRGVGAALRQITRITAALGDVPAALDAFRQALAAWREIGEVGAPAGYLVDLAAGVLAAGDVPRALRLTGAAAASLDAMGPGADAGRLLTRRAGRMPGRHSVPAALARVQAALRARVGRVAAERVWAQMAAMAADDALAYALAPTPDGAAVGLTPRETEVAVLLGRCATNRAIAAQLVISERTAKRHVENILLKLGVRSRAQVAEWARRRGVLPAD